MFELASSYRPKGDQSRAIEKLVKNLELRGVQVPFL
jgi:excinuclease UvrABC helicase subunit UvrB